MFATDHLEADESEGLLQEPYTYKDLYVGAQVVINRFNFALENADEYTISYMENNKHLFIMGDGQAVLKLLKAQVAVRVGPSKTLQILLSANPVEND